jgi:hypothetical protein
MYQAESQNKRKSQELKHQAKIILNVVKVILCDVLEVRKWLFSFAGEMADKTL